MTSLIRLRLLGMVRRQIALVAPAGALLIVLFLGALTSPVRDVATACVVVLFPAIVYQARIGVDLEPPEQTELATLAVGGPRRRVAADILAGLLAAGPFVLVAYAIAMVGGLLHGGVAFSDLGQYFCRATRVSCEACNRQGR